MAYYSKNVPGSAYTFKPTMPAPVQVIDKFNKEETARKAAEAKAVADQEKENRKNLQNTLKYNPESVIKEYDADIKKILHEDFIPFAASKHRGGRSPSADDLADIQKRKNDIELLLEKQKAVKENIDGALSQVKGDKEINQDWVYQRVEDFIYETDENGNKRRKDLATIDPEEVNRILESPEAYNVDAVVSNFSDNIGENIESHIKEGGGSSRPWRENKEVKSKYLVLDGNGDPEVDDNGNYVLNLTPSTLKMAMNNPRMAGAINQEAARMAEETGEDVTKMEAFKKLMAPKAYHNATVKRTSASVKTDAGDGSNFIFGNKKLHNDTAARYDSIGRVLMNKDTQELNRIIGDDVKEARFTNIHPVSGGKLETPHLLIYTKNSETTETERETYDNEGNPIITKNKTTGSSPQVFDVTSPTERGKALYLLNELMTKNNGSKVTDDQLKAYIDHLKQNEPGALFEAKYKKKEPTSKQPSFRPWEKSEAKAKADDIIDSLLE